MKMIKFRNIIWATSILLSYPLYSIGQIFLFLSKRKDPDFYNLITKYPGEWITAHVFLMISLVLLVPAYISLCHYFKNSRSYSFIQLSTFFTILAVFVLFGQFTIDLCIVDIFKLPRETAYQTLNGIQNDPLISSLFYNNAKLFILFKYADLTLLGQLFLGITLLLSKRIPIWAKILFFVALILTQFGILIDPYYGRMIKRLSYSLISISLAPIAIEMLRRPGDQRGDN